MTVMLAVVAVLVKDSLSMSMAAAAAPAAAADTPAEMDDATLNVGERDGCTWTDVGTVGAAAAATAGPVPT